MSFWISVFYAIDFHGSYLMNMDNITYFPTYTLMEPRYSKSYSKSSVLLGFCWIPPFVYMIVLLVLSNRLKLCKYHVNKLYCDNWSMVKLSCESIVINNIYGFFVISFYSCFMVFVILSYIKIIIACKASLECRRKFWQTCVPHMFTVMNYVVAVFFDAMYSRYGSSNVSENLQHFLALEMLQLGDTM